MKKKADPQLNMFAQSEALSQSSDPSVLDETTTKAPATKIVLSKEVLCPKCGGYAQASYHPEWHQGLTHYCTGKCMGEFYFTP